MKILILGSSGQVGAYLVDYLKLKGHSVSEFDLINGAHEDLRIHGNPLLAERIAAADFVYFLAFDVGGSRYLSKYQHTVEFINNNMSIMLNTFNVLKDNKKPFVFASSQMSNMTYSPYGVLKAIGETYTRALDGRIVKFWNVYGIEHNLEKSHVITDFILKARDNGVIDMMTDGQEEREFLYADDCCRALEIVMNNYYAFDKNSDLNITSFNSVKVIDIAKIIANKFNATIIPANNTDMVQLNKKNEASKLILEYWNPQVSLEEGISYVIEGLRV
jgi:nucleoside-diphosphate-sugar epimerase